MARKKDETATSVTRLRITAPDKGFRRAGRCWQGVTEVPIEGLAAEQIAQLKAEPKLAVEEL